MMSTMKTCTMTEAKNDICRIIRQAERKEVLVLRHGKPAAAVIGFQDEDDWTDYRLEHDEKFLRKIDRAREESKRGRFVPLSSLPG